MARKLQTDVSEIDRRLDDKEWAARVAAVTRTGALLRECEDEALFQRLLSFVERAAGDAKWEVRKAAAVVLGGTNDSRGSALLERLSADENVWVRNAAVAAQKKLRGRGGARADPTLDQILAVIERVKPRKLSRDALLRLARVFGDLHYDDLASETAHELRTLVTSLDGYVLAMSDRARQLAGDDAVMAEVSGKLRDRSRFLTRLVEDLCAYTATPGEVTRVSLERIVADAVDLAKARVGADRTPKGVALLVDVPGDLELEGVHDRLARAIANLVANAIEAISESGTVRVTAEPAGTAILLRVADTGCGMTAEQLDLARRRYKTLKRDRGGTGLGLPIAERIVEREHRGRLDIESAPGRGTTITLELPRSQPRDAG